MTDIASITDFDTLKQIALLQDQEIAKLHCRLAELTEQLARLEGKDPVAELKRELAELKRQLTEHQRKRFGKSSERRPRTKPRDNKARKKRTKFGRRCQPDLPHRDCNHKLSPDSLGCKICGGELEPTSEVVDAGEEITVVERRFEVVRHRRLKYRCHCKGSSVTAPGPTKLAPRGRYSLEFAIHVAIDKYRRHLPLARQVREMRTRGLLVDTQTLWDQLQLLARHLQPCYDLIRHFILGADVVGADETWWRLMKQDSTQKWWVWAISTHDAVFYRVDPSRSSEAARHCLGDYRGIVMCDGYVAYKTLANDRNDLTLAHCWSHARRKFFDAHKNYPDECDKVLDWLGQLFLIERKAPSPERLEGEAKTEAMALRAKLRETESRPIINKLKTWAHEQTGLPGSGLRKAIEYMVNHWTGLTQFLEDPMIPLHNNHMEQELRNWVVGRKNHYGSRSQRGTEVAALFYTLIETATLCGVDPAQYLHHAATAAIEHPGYATLPHELISPTP